jgi:hypothetical protein
VFAAPIPAFANPAFPVSSVLPAVASAATASQAVFSGLPPARETVMCRVQYIEDPNANLKDLQRLQNGEFFIADTNLLVGAIRILEKNGLIEFKGESTSVSTLPLAGGLESAESREKSPAPIWHTSERIWVQEADGKLRIKLRMRREQKTRSHELQLMADLEDGQSLLTKTDAVGEQPMYLLVSLQKVPPQYDGPFPTTVTPTIPPIATVPPAIQPTQFAAPAQPPRSPAVQEPRIDQPRAAQVLYRVAILEDTSDSLAAFMPPAGQPPFQLTDTPTMLAALRILERQNLVKRTSSPNIVALTGREANFRVGGENPGKDPAFEGLQIDLLGRELGGGLRVDFKLNQSEGPRKLDVQLDLFVPHGQSVIMRASQRADDSPSKDKSAGEKAAHPVYVVLTPEIVR